MLIDEMLKNIRNEGWLVNSLYQIDEYFWRASLRNADLCFEVGEGETAYAALRAALQLTKNRGHDWRDKRFPNGPSKLTLDDLGL